MFDRRSVCAAVFVVACSSPRPEGVLDLPPATPAQPPAALSAAAPPAPELPSAAPRASAVASASASPPTEPPLLASASTTPNKISCSTVVCDLATETCCESWGNDHRVGQCAPQKGFAGCPARSVLWKKCDEPADCGKGSVCCYMPAIPDSIAENVCRPGRCENPEIETCLVGGKCGGGKRCKPSAAGSDTGYCTK